MAALVLKVFSKMAPKGRPRARAKAQAPARRVASSNVRRGRRREAVRALNELCSEVGLGHAVVDAKAAEAATVKGLVRLLERRDLSGGRLDRLRTAAKAFLDNGGVFAAEVATAASTAPFVLRHKVLAPGFKLKSKAFMATYNGAYCGRLRQCCEAINKDYNVDGLCRDLLPRVQKLRAHGGGRIQE